MTKCSVKSCANDSRSSLKKDGVSYFNFPRDPIRFAEWAAIIAKGRGDKNYKPSKRTVVCSDHFSHLDIYTTDKGYKRLIRCAKPTLSLMENNGSNDNNICQKLVKLEEESNELSYLVENNESNYHNICQKPVKIEEESNESSYLVENNESNHHNICQKPVKIEEESNESSYLIENNESNHHNICQKPVKVEEESKESSYYLQLIRNNGSNDHSMCQKSVKIEEESIESSYLIENNRSKDHNICQNSVKIEEESNESSYVVTYNAQDIFSYSESSTQQAHDYDNSEEMQQTPSSSLSIGSILDTPMEVVLKKKLNKYEEMIKNKNRQIDRLQKQIKRLAKKNIDLKKAVYVYKKRKEKDLFKVGVLH
ncbi:unnamed protein product [Chilo suppressalis]|uniref:THAP-type domain-containing protein n=1 Tax=Chilo suppressalis TaxID=168631 RepID=A0ABN8BCT1_CHISP|nr:hypothetical protein evm_000591 [Chilo suppressalis]CAH0406604.1 unnamed protein product [Chilo suppressalis]